MTTFISYFTRNCLSNFLLGNKLLSNKKGCFLIFCFFVFFFWSCSNEVTMPGNPDNLTNATNQPPVIAAQSFTALESISDTEVIGTVVASDPENQSLTYSILVNDNNLFEISGTNGDLSLATGQQFDLGVTNSHVITVQVSDGELSNDALITVFVSNILTNATNQPPVIAAQSFTALENISDTELIGTVVASDPEEQSLTYSILVNDNNLFEISGTNGELSLATNQQFDLGVTNSHVITVQVFDGELSNDALITVISVQYSHQCH